MTIPRIVEINREAINSNSKMILKNGECIIQLCKEIRSLNKRVEALEKDAADG